MEDALAEQVEGSFPLRVDLSLLAHFEVRDLREQDHGACPVGLLEGRRRRDQPVRITLLIA